jgi:DNA polymerase III subunit epsilon
MPTRNLWGRLWHMSRAAETARMPSAERDGSDLGLAAFLRSLRRERKETGARLPLADLEVVVVDLETTGFSPDRGDAILSIGAVAMRGEQLLLGESFYSLVDPGRPIPPHVASLTGIRDEMVRTAPDPAAALQRFFQFVGNRPLVAHHSRHERQFFRAALWKHGRRRFSHRLLDTMLLVRLSGEVIGSSSLDALCAAHGIHISRRHHAYCDAVAAASLWGIYLGKAIRRGYTDLGEIYEELR